MSRPLILCAALVAWCYAPAAWCVEFWTDWTTITTLYPVSTEFDFTTAYSNSSLSTCDSGSRWQIGSGSPEYKTQVAALMAAFYAGREVRLNIVVTAPTCAAVVNRFFVR